MSMVHQLNGDIVYLVAIYSLYVNLVALRLRRTPESWRWLFSS